ncbi:hypothetical protein CCS92_30600, partial [Methylobacterium radiotolerans]
PAPPRRPTPPPGAGLVRLCARAWASASRYGTLYFPDRATRNLLLYPGFIGQRPFVRILVRRVIGPVELLLLSEVGRCRLMMGLEGVGGSI